MDFSGRRFSGVAAVVSKAGAVGAAGLAFAGGTAVPAAAQVSAESQDKLVLLQVLVRFCADFLMCRYLGNTLSPPWTFSGQVIRVSAQPEAGG